MSDVAITLVLNQSCPDMIFTRTITPNPLIQLQESDFNQYATLTLSFPNGQSLSLSSLDASNWIDPTLDTISFETLLVGLFTINYTTLPSLRPNQSANFSWNAGDNFYDGGVIYQVNTNGILIPSLSASNSAQIATYLGSGDIQVIPVSQIASQYKAIVSPGNTFQFWCNLYKCLQDKMHSLNKANLKGQALKSIEETEMLDTVLQLYFIYNYLLVNTLDQTNPNDYKTIVEFSNYINSICGCNGCCKLSC